MHIQDKANSPTLAALARDFAYGRKFVAFIGSGTSCSAGLPSWKTLRTRLETRLSAIAPRTLSAMTPEERTNLIAHLKRIPDPWEAFSGLKSRLPKYDYVQVIRMALNDATVDVPASLSRIWQSTNIEGMVSLNLDTLASRAYSQIYQGRREPMRASGDHLDLAQRLLSEYKQYIIQLHGNIDDENAWVFTKEDRDRLFSDERYINFMSALMNAKRVLFIGCSPDDIAISSHLDRIALISGKSLQHYWFAPSNEMSGERRDRMFDLGISVIEYDIPHDAIRARKAHDEALAELFDYLESFQYQEPEPDPINPMAPPIGDRLPPERVQAMQPEQARNLLSRYASSILESDDTSYTQYGKFLRDYGPAIAVASYVPRHGEALLFGHEVKGEIGSGAFSRVFEASSSDGQKKAIKLVRNEVREDPKMLRSFRRGVKSMKIISDNNIDGMVWYSQAYEIPPCVMMPFIEGQNLEDVVRHKDYSFIALGLPIVRRVGDIVSSAHQLRQRVLHRDLRPANIMLMPDSLDATISDRVVVLDFDLSWHEGADGDSSISPSMTTVLGYLAPEQITHDLNVEARNSKVDSYGLCMTLLYMIEGRHIEYQQRTSRDWESFISKVGATKAKLSNWRSWLPRIRRLIELGTIQNQKERLDFEVVVNQLHILETLSSGVDINTAGSLRDGIPIEAICEEILSRVVENDTYDWNSFSGFGSYVGVRGGTVKLEEVSQNGERRVRLIFEKTPDGTQQFETIKKYWHAQTKNIRDLLRSAGWNETEATNKGYAGISLAFDVSEEDLWMKSKDLTRSAAQAWTRLSLL